MPLRLACTIFLLISVCAFPLFFTLGIGLFSIVWFRGYYEAIGIAFVSDSLYGVALMRFHSFPYIMTVAAAILVILSVVLRRQFFVSHEFKI
jgi:hypothetical protein